MSLLAIALLMSIPACTIGQQICIETDLRMLALGDSYTIGESVQSADRWPHQFIRELELKGFVATDPDYLATTGWTTGDLLSAMNSCLDTAADYNLVSILIGVNNQYKGQAISMYKPHLEEIIERALRIVGGDPCKVFILSIPDYAFTPFGDGKERISKEIDQYNAINREMASDYKLPWVDITPISREGLSNTALVAKDGLHPSARQYKQWILELMPRLFLPDGK